jgi:Domain of Unknown Function with PDB structure (DUF3857)/Domain of Unknown Function with PDB structure (DUF3858)
MYQNFLLKTALLFLIPICIEHQKAFTQDKPLVTFGKVTAADFDLPKSTVIDSNTNAVVIANVGSIEFVGNKKSNWVSYVYKKNTRIKILNKKAFDLAKIIIHLNGVDDHQDKIDNLQASTYNLENGKVTETKLNTTDIYDEQVRKSLFEKRFTMPDLKGGSIIEYSYQITSFHYYNLPDWNFQYLHYPCLYSEFKISVPDLLRYLTIKYGIDSFYIVKSKDSYTTLKMATVNVGTNIHDHIWVMKDIPSFKNEDFITAPERYLDKLEFNLAQTYNGDEVSSVATNWDEANKKLLNDDDFGKAIEVDNAGNLYNTMTKICSTEGDVMQAARQIYSYIRDQFTCVPNNDIFLQGDLYDVNKKRKGSVSELNLLLIALLRQRGIQADPMLVATRSYGHISEIFPVFEKINYVICRMTFGKDTIYLDASDADIAFGKIPLDCYNGLAEIIDRKHRDSSYLYSSDIKEPDITSILLVNNDKGNGENGSLQSTLGYYESYDLRSSFKEKDGQEKYLKEIKKDYGPDVDISNLHIDSLKNVDEPVKVTYDINYKSGFDGDIIYFNPVLNGDYKENPFRATEERRYPVEFAYPVDDTYDLTMDIPNGYKVDELPKSIQANFNGGDGMFLYRIQKDDYTVQLHIQIKINKAIFAPEDYNALRDFFSMVVKKQSEQVVFKKK